MCSKMIHVTPGLGWERRNQESSRECENDHISEVIKRMCGLNERRLGGTG